MHRGSIASDRLLPAVRARTGHAARPAYAGIRRRGRPGELRVIDYKSGGSHLSAQDLIEGRRLQLPIYALAASQALCLGDAAEGFYWKLFQGEPSSLKLSRFQCEAGSGAQAALTVAANHVEAIVNRICQGTFDPEPPIGGCPSYCPAAAWCWQFLPVKF